MKRLIELRAKRAKIVAQMRDLLDRAEREGRITLSAEEDAAYTTAFSDQEAVAAEIEREERQIELDRRLASLEAPTAPSERPQSRRASAEYGEAFRRYLIGGRDALGADEYRAMQADADTLGGYLVMPEQFVDALIQDIDNQVFVRGRATVYPVATAQSLGAPSLDADPADADWTTELATGSEDSTMAIGKRELHPHPVAKRIKLSAKLIRLSPSAETLVRSRLAYKFAVTQEKAFLTGSGAGQPLGLFTASAQGISTSRDMATDNTTTAITFDGLINAKYSVKGGYWPRASWMFHRDAMKMISKLKDADGQYLWRASVREGEPDMILGHAVDVSEYVPNTFTTGLYVGLFGDLSYYWIADAMDMTLQRLVELYAETNQIGYIGRMESDGMPVMENAFARVTLA